MLREIGNSIKATLYERAISPLSGVIAIVWIGFNWKALAVFFWGREDIASRISHIETHYVDVWQNLYYPAIVSAILLVVYPFAALAVYALWEKVTAWKMSLKQSFEGTVALSVPKSIALWNEMREQDKIFRNAIETKDVRIAELEKTNEAVVNELSKLKESLSKGSALEVEIAKRTEELAAAEKMAKDLRDQLTQRDTIVTALHQQMDALAKQVSTAETLSDEEWRVLSFIADAENMQQTIDLDKVYKTASLSRLEGNAVIDKLTTRNFIGVQAGTGVLRLHQPGRAYVVQRKRDARVSKAPPPIEPLRT